MTILVSVVVPTCRREHLLERCLQALVSQQFPPHAYEIIVVDDSQESSSTRELSSSTRELVGEWQRRLQPSYAFPAPAVITPIPVTGMDNPQETDVIYQVAAEPLPYPRLVYLSTRAEKHGPAAARNLGWRSAAGEIIAFTDDDCIPEPDWLANGMAALVEGVAGVSGRTVVPMPANPFDYELNAAHLQRSDFITANCFYRRAVLEEVGGFDERFATAWREDSDLYFRIREHNHMLAWARGAIVVHPVRPEKWGSSLRNQRKSFYNALLYKKHPQLYWRYIQSAPPWNYYAILLAALAAAAGLMFASPLLAAAGLLAWTGLTGAFIYRRLQHTARTPVHVIEMALTSLVIPFLSIYWRLRGAIHWRVLFL